MSVVEGLPRDPRITAALIVFVLSFGATVAPAQSNQQLPVVVAASVPFYPPVAQVAHITGDVRLRVSTDGKRVSAISLESGPPMLASVAEENVRTWQFKERRPTTFETTFHYKLVPSKCDSKCNCDFEFDSGKVLLKLPTDVEVTAKGIEICDPAGEIKPRSAR